MAKKGFLKNVAKVVSAALMVFSSTGVIAPVYAEDNAYQLVKGSTVADVDMSNFVHTAGAWTGYPEFDLWVREIMVQNTLDPEDTRAAWCTQPGIPTYVTDVYRATTEHPEVPEKYTVTPDYEGAKKVLAAYYANHFSDNSLTRELDNELVGTMEGYAAVQLAVWTKVLQGDINKITVNKGYEKTLELAKQLIAEADSMELVSGTNLVHMTAGDLQVTTIEDNSSFELQDMNAYSLQGREGYYYGTDLISVNPKQSFLTFDRKYNVSVTGAPEGTILAANDLDGNRSAVLAAADSSGNISSTEFGFNSPNGTTFRLFIPYDANLEDVNMTVNITDGEFYRTDFQFWVTDTSRQAFISPTTNPETFNYSFTIINDALPEQTEETPEQYVTSALTIKKVGNMPGSVSQEDGVNVINWGVYLLPGATFDIYYGEDFTDSYGVEHHEGEIAIAGVTTRKDGMVKVRYLPVKESTEEGVIEQTLYKVVESDAPDGYKNSDTEYSTTIGSVIVPQSYVDDGISISADGALTQEDVGKLLPIEGDGVDNGVYADGTTDAETHPGIDPTFIANTPITLSLSFNKTDENGNALAGAEFGLYTTRDIIFPTSTGGGALPEGSLVAKMVSADDGTVTLDTGKYVLPTSMNYTMKELSAPEGYILDSTEYTVIPDAETGVGRIYSHEDIADSNDEYINSEEGQNDENASSTAVTSAKDEVTVIDNELFKGKIKVVKTDDNSTPLEGVEFELRDADGEVLETKTTDANGEINFETEIAYGETVTVAETQPLEGYAKLAPVEVTMDDMSEPLVTLNLTNSKLPYFAEIRKIDTLTKEPIQGVEFSLYEEGNDTPLETKATDENGVATFTTELSQNKKYYAMETGTPDGYLPNSEKYNISPINITDENNTVTITVENQKEAIVEIEKRSSSDYNNIPLAGAEFTIYESTDENRENPVDVQTTDDEGKASFSGLDYKKDYVLVETKAPVGYSAAEDVAIDFSDEEIAAEKVVHSVSIQDNPLEFEIRITKHDLKDEAVFLEGAEFTLYAADDTEFENPLATAVTDENGYAVFTGVRNDRNYIVVETKAPDNYLIAKPIAVNVEDVNKSVYEYSIADEKVPYWVQVLKVDDKTEKALEGAEFGLYVEGSEEPIETAVTGSDGIAVFETKLSQYESYYIQEIKAPEHYELNKNRFDIAYNTGEAVDNEEGNIVKQYTVGNARMLYTAEITKNDIRDGFGTLQGAEFTLYRADDENLENPVATAVSDQNGIARFTGLDITESFIAVETKAPDGYLLSDERIEITPPDVSKDTTTEHYSRYTFDNQRKAEIAVLKMSSSPYDNRPLADAEFTLYDAEDMNTALDVKTTGANGKVTFENLDYNRTYVVAETKAPLGYKAAENQTITFSENEIMSETIVHNVTFNDDVLEFPVEIIKQDSEDNSRKLEGAEFTIYAADDTDYKKPLETVSTDENGRAVFEKVAVDRNYVVRETRPPYGYRDSSEIIKIDMNDMYYDSENPATFEVEPYVFENDPMKITVQVIKESNDISDVPDTPENESRLYGAQFQLFRADDTDFENPIAVTATEESGVYMADESSENHTIITNANGTASVGNLRREEYVLKETGAPGGHELNLQNFRVDASTAADNSTVSITVMDNMIPGIRTANVLFTKRDDSGRFLPGAELQVLDASTEEVLSTWTSSVDSEIFEIRSMLPGTYILRETKAPFGYMLAGDIEFTVRDNGTIDCEALEEGVIVMVDESSENPGTKISKQNVDGEKIQGARLTILDSEGKPVYTWTSEPERTREIPLDPGKYTLHEVMPPEGYQVAEDIAFEVTETGEVISDALKDGEIVMIDYRDGENPKTGLEGKDIWKGVGFVAIGVALIAGVTIVAVKNRKKKEGEQTTDKKAE